MKKPGPRSSRSIEIVYNRPRLHSALGYRALTEAAPEMLTA